MAKGFRKVWPFHAKSVATVGAQPTVEVVCRMQLALTKDGELLMEGQGPAPIVLGMLALATADVLAQRRSQRGAAEQETVDTPTAPRIIVPEGVGL